MVRTFESILSIDYDCSCCIWWHYSTLFPSSEDHHGGTETRICYAFQYANCLAQWCAACAKNHHCSRSEWTHTWCWWNACPYSRIFPRQQEIEDSQSGQFNVASNTAHEFEFKDAIFTDTPSAMSQTKLYLNKNTSIRTKTLVLRSKPMYACEIFIKQPNKR